MIAYNKTRGVEVASRVERADTAGTRMKGLLGRESMEPGEGMWIMPCSMIHTLFMRFPIDTLFLGRDLRVRRVVEELAPWRFSPWVFSAHSVLELRGGALKGSVRVGDELEFKRSALEQGAESSKG